MTPAVQTFALISPGARTAWEMLLVDGVIGLIVAVLCLWIGWTLRGARTDDRVRRWYSRHANARWTSGYEKGFRDGRSWERINLSLDQQFEEEPCPQQPKKPM